MAEVSTTRFESVIAGIRGYLGEQLGELERELDEARQSVAELHEQLAAKQASIEVLVASRHLLATKLGELDGAMTESAVVVLPAQLRAEPEEAAAPQAEAVAAAEPPAESPVEAPAETPAEALTDAAEEEPVTTARGLNAGQRQVLVFLEAMPGVHRVSEIAAGVAGPDAGNAAAQAVRRALAALLQAGLATKSVQSGTAFYSATATETSPTTATATTETVESAEAAEEVPVAPASGRARTRKAAPVKAKQPAPKKAAKRAVRATVAATPVDGAASDEAPAFTARTRKPRAAKGHDAAEAPAAQAAAPVGAAGKPLRADRTKIVATLLAATEPQSAGEVSRTVMGDDWRASDATNFRQVLKGMTAEGLVAEHLGDNNRTRYTATADPDLGTTGAAAPRSRRSRGKSTPGS